MLGACPLMEICFFPRLPFLYTSYIWKKVELIHRSLSPRGLSPSCSQAIEGSLLSLLTLCLRGLMASGPRRQRGPPHSIYYFPLKCQCFRASRPNVCISHFSLCRVLNLLEGVNEERGAFRYKLEIFKVISSVRFPYL